MTHSSEEITPAKVREQALWWCRRRQQKKAKCTEPCEECWQWAENTLYKWYATTPTAATA